MVTKAKSKKKKVRKVSPKTSARLIEQEMIRQEREWEAAKKQYRVRAKVIGKLLIEAKTNLGHGEFESWIEENFGFTSRTARQYMSFARGETDTLMTGQQRG